MRPGDLKLKADHIASFVPSPLVGPNDDEWGVRFPDMTQVYDLEMQDIIRLSAQEIDLDMKEGVYLQVTGPQFETPAEIRAYKTLGADVAGMSTAVEAIALRHMGARVAGISCVTNLASGLGGGLLTAEEVIEVGVRVGDTFSALLTAIVSRMRG
jgi:purine-nucleoside phosphorylase